MRSELIAEYMALHERWKSVQRGVQIHDVPRLKLNLKVLRDFLDRWQGESGGLATERTLSELRAKNQRITAVLESWFLEALHRVIDKRVRWLIAEHRFRFAVEYISVVQIAPPILQAQLRGLFFHEFGYEFRAERLYREAEAVADCHEREYKKALSTLATDWPERVTTELRSRLCATNPRQLRRWKATLPMPSLSLWNVAL